MAKSKNADGLLATVDAAELAKGLSYVNGALARRNTIPIRDCVRLTAIDGGLRLAVTNLDQQSEAHLSADVQGEGALCVDAKRLAETVARFKGELLLDGTKGALKLSVARCRAEIPVLPAGDFNDLRGPDEGHSFEISSGVLMAGFASVMHCCSKEEQRYYLNGVFVQPGAGFMRFTATDGHRLASLKVTSGVPDAAVFEPMIVPRTVLRDYIKFLERADGVVFMTVDDNRLQLSSGGETHITKLIDGTFPDYERVIPKGPFNRLTVPVSDLKTAVSAAMTACQEKSRAVKFETEEGVLKCSSRTEAQFCEASIEAVDIEPAEPFGLNGAYVLEALDVLRSEEVELNFSDSGGPILFSTGDELRQVVMPLRV